MGLTLCMVLLLLGSWAVLGAFLRGDRLRREGNSVVPRATPRILTALALLGSSGVAGLVDVVREPADKIYPAYGALGLLGLGVGATVSALRRASLGGGPEASQPRITKQGWAALALLSSAEVLGVLNDRLVDTFNRLQGQAGAVSTVFGTLGLLSLVLGTGTAVWTFLPRSPATGDTESKPRRVTPKPWWTLAALGLAAVALMLTNWMLPTPEGLLGLVLLILGVGTGLFAYFFDVGVTSPGQPAFLRISPRRWVSLGLLVLATGVVALEQIQAWTGYQSIDARQIEAARRARNLAEVRDELAKMEAELHSLRIRPPDGRSWDDLRRLDEPGGPAGSENAHASTLEDEFDELRSKLARLEASPNGSQAALLSPSAQSVDLATWKWGPGSAGPNERAGADRARRALLENEVAQLRAKVTRMEAETNKAKPAPSPAAPANMDLSTWGWNSRGGRQDTSAPDDGYLQPAVAGHNRIRQ